MSGFRPSSALRGLLAPRLESCLACGRPARLGASLPRICETCAAGVPWIAEPRCLACGRAQGCPDCLRPEARSRAFELNRSAVLYDAAMREWISAYKYGGREAFAEPFSIMLEQAYRRMRRELSASPDVWRRSGGTGMPQIALPERLYWKETEREGGAASWFRRIRSSVALERSRVPVWKADLVTWVPVSGERLEERGFNQAELVARGMARRLGLPAGNLLVRDVHTGKQSFKTRAERLHNLDGAFSLVPNLDPRIFHQWDSIGSRKRPGGFFPTTLLLVDDIYTTGTTASVCASVLKRLEPLLGRPVLVYSLTLARS